MKIVLGLRLIMVMHLEVGILSIAKSVLFALLDRYAWIHLGWATQW